MPVDGTLERIVLSLYVYNASGNPEEVALDFELYASPFTENDPIAGTLIASGHLLPTIPPFAENITLTADQNLNVHLTETTRLALALKFSSEYTTLIEAYLSGGLYIVPD